MSTNNLHLVKIVDQYAAGSRREQMNNNYITSMIECHFKDLETVLLQKIMESDAIVGCVAWLTSIKILNAFKKVKHGVAIVVQKEDFLRPDTLLFDKIKLNGLYTSIKSLTTYHADCLFKHTFVNELNVHGGVDREAIRCVGNHNSMKNPAFPRMHNKFLIFGKIQKPRKEELRKTDEVMIKYDKKFIPYAVWTGSLNLTKSATHSFENAVYIKDINIVNAYMKEWGQIYSLSEPLDWTSEYCEPELRIGS